METTDDLDTDCAVCTKCQNSKPYSEFYTDKYTKSGLRHHCKKCCRDYAMRVYKKDPQKAHERVRKYYGEHPDIKKQRNADYSKINSSRIVARVAAWSKANPEKRSAISRRYYAQRSVAGGSYTQSQWVELCNRYEMKCLCCGLVKPLTADHVIPIVRGGSSNISNIQPLCRSCNSKKHDKDTDYR